MLKAQTTAILCVTALAVSACGGGGDSADDNGKDTAKTPTPSATATPTPTSTPTAGKPKPPPCKKVKVDDIDVCKVGLARDRFIILCGKRRTKPETRDDKTDMRELRKATTTLIRAFRANPDEKWRRAKGLPKLAMRARVVSLGLVARKQCGGGDAVKLGERMTRAVGKIRPQS